MQTTPSRSTQRGNRPALPQLILGGADKFFWLAAYFNDLSRAETLRQVCDEMHRRNRCKRVTLALAHGECALLDQARNSLKHVVNEGMLPFAHDRTTVFAELEAA